MPIVLADDTCQVVLSYTGSMFASGGGATVLGFRNGANYSTVTLEAHAVDVATSWLDNFQTATTDGVTLESVRAVSRLISAEVPAGVTGTITTDTTPPNTAALAVYTTASRGRRGRGRSFLPGVTFENTTSDQGVIDGAWRTSLETSLVNFFGDIETANGSFQVILQNSEGETPPITPAPAVISQSISGLVATQRRRLRP